MGAFVPDGPLVVGIDETLERRRGKKISAKGIYRDPVRSSHSHLVKSSALRWVCLTLLAEVPWANRVWSMPFLSALAYSERYAREQGKRHKTLTEWAWQLLLLVRRWWPERKIVAVADSTYASLRLLERCRSLSNPIAFITRLRLDAALYEPASPRRPGQMGRPRLKGERLPNLSVVAEDPATEWTLMKLAHWYGEGERAVEVVSQTAVWYSTGFPAVPVRWVLIRDPKEEFKTQALLCTDLDAKPEQIILSFVRRWQMEATFQEVRQRLGFETQRHWSDMAVRRTAPDVGTILASDPFRSSVHGQQERKPRSRSGLVREATPDLLRRFGAGEEGVVGTRSDFLQVTGRDRHGKSPKGFDGTANRRGLLCGVMAKVQLYGILGSSSKNLRH